MRPVFQKLIPLLVLANLATGQTNLDSTSPSSSVARPLTVDEVVNNLVRKDEERSRALQCSKATRVYRFSYHGFPSDREAEMTVDAIYRSPNNKTFKVISQSGSKLVVDRVFKKLLETEKEAATPEIRRNTLLNRDNYNFELAGYERTAQGGEYVLQVTPKVKNKYVYRGKIWVDDIDFAVTRIEAEPAQNPSFWTRKSEIRHEYSKVDGLWLPTRNESSSYVRFGGRAVLTIDYKYYRVTAAANHSPSTTAVTAGVGNSR